MKPEDHIRITEKAIQIYHKHAQSEFSAQLLQNSKMVERGSKKEDTSPVCNRITNWHFFKQNEQLQPTTVYYLRFIPLLVTPTSDVILKNRFLELKRELTNDGSTRLEDLIGRVLHHIQDMRTPAHVVPIYHGPKLHDSFEDYSYKHTDSELQSIDINAQEYGDLCSDNIMSIYNNAANETLRYLYDDPSSRFIFENGEQAGWDLFWRRFSDGSSSCGTDPYEKVSGFGCYGPLGKEFGETTVELNGSKRKIDPEVYISLHRWVLRKQITDSLRTLIAIDSL